VKIFRDRVAVVTGAASGIGLALAERFAAEGMKIVMADVEADALERAAAALRGRAAAVLATRVDVARAEDVERLARETYAAFGAAHVVCNNAGVAVIGAVHEHSLADWQWVMGVNLWGVIHGVRAFVPRMLAGGDEGHIVNTASIAGLATAANPYNVSKHGVVCLTEGIYRDLREMGARLSASVVCPGLINTNILDAERNREHGERTDIAAQRTEVQQFATMFEEALRQGYAPDVVADHVLDGIRSDRFYILPAQSEVLDMVDTRFTAILERRNPELR